MNDVVNEIKALEKKYNSCCANCKNWGEYYEKVVVSPNVMNADVCHFYSDSGGSTLSITSDYDWCARWEEKEE